MIRLIRISNFAIIENIEVGFHDGLNIITGETGAGKSIVIEAVSLALGSRADTAFVRSGQDKAVVQMIAEDGEDEYIITREVSRTGRNLCKVNGSIVTLAELSALCRRLADIHGQYDHQSLLDPDRHIRLLDRYGAGAIDPARENVRRRFAEYIRVKTELSDLKRRLAEDMRQRDFMSYEWQELSDAGLSAGEDDALEETILRLRNSEQIFEDLSAAYGMAEEGDYSALGALRQIADRLSSTARWSAEVRDLADRTDSLYYELEDIAGEIRNHRDRAVFSPGELDQAIGRLDLLSRLKQKHGKSIEELIAYRDELELRLRDVDDSGRRREDLERELALRTDELSAACHELTEARKAAALTLQERIAAELTELNFSDSRFLIDFQPLDGFTEDGADRVEFLISTNRGEELKPLAKIASGGEMSRIMLAFKKIIGDYDEIPTMIFDEIDSGISGVAASVVGRKLLEISQSHQVICITHLPQIAACGTHHYRITKDSDDQKTYTRIGELSGPERVDEIARLLGGANVTATTRRTAEELLAASHG